MRSPCSPAPRPIDTLLLRSDFAQIVEYGLWRGFDHRAVIAVASSALGGLIVSAVLKYADSVLKGYATAISVILTGILSALFFGTSLDLHFTLAVVNVCCSIALYSNPSGGAAAVVAAAASGGASCGGIGGGGGGGPGARMGSGAHVSDPPTPCGGHPMDAVAAANPLQPATSDGPSHGAGLSMRPRETDGLLQGAGGGGGRGGTKCHV